MTILPIIPVQRSCGPCTECCVSLPIPAGRVSDEAKPAGAPCPHVRQRCGCTIYPSRPATCRDFRCAWLADKDWPASWRPNESGLFCLREMLDDDVPAAVVYEIRPDALSGPCAVDILEALVRTAVVVVVVTFQQRRLRLRGKWRVDRAQTSLEGPHFAMSRATLAEFD